ncbi:uncharacterized protein LOC123511349 isoform X4 [Portunus trituberculatus]|uniref:uncharacterized protein LOC123511349 isoform X4 n=1 Tax=Portunus trituberculatus TaxID=210409 RepID=UPI001E1CE6F3|nr:uncharacterized protein LOC123511349 isoform X4 [Portunus trituberculatus]
MKLFGILSLQLLILTIHSQRTFGNKDSLSSSVERDSKKAGGKEYSKNSQHNKIQDKGPTQDQVILNLTLTEVEKHDLQLQSSQTRISSERILVNRNLQEHQSTEGNQYRNASPSPKRKMSQYNSAKSNEEWDQLTSRQGKENRDVVWTLHEDGDFEAFTSRAPVVIVYFYRNSGLAALIRFLREYNKSAQELLQYNVLLATVECGEYQVASYCASDKINRFAYGFRGGQEKIAFPLDTLFNSNAIVASALHLALINTVPILQTAGERRNLEKRCRGHCDLIFAYLRTLGTLEHRTFLEVAHAHQSSFVFAITTYTAGTLGLPPSPYSENEGGESKGMDHRSNVDFLTMDGLSSANIGQGTKAHHTENECTTTFLISGRTSDYDSHPTDGMSFVRQQLRGRGVSSEGTEIIMASWRPGTMRQYRPHINRWSSFCDRWNINPSNPPVTNVLNFLSETFHGGVGYESVNTARGALSALGIILEGCRARNHPLINRFMRGVFNLRRSCPRYAETWDVWPVLQKLRSIGLLPDLFLKSLTLKLVMLMALNQAVRVHTLHLLLYSNASVDNNSVSLLLGGNIKQCHPKFNVRMLTFHAYVPDSRICVMNTLKEYHNRTKNLRKEFGKDNGKLLISLEKPHKSVSKDTAARWIKTVFANCGINTKKFMAGSVRPASTSQGNAMDVPVPIILSKAGWTQETTFAKHYNKITQVSDSFQEAILDSVL